MPPFNVERSKAGASQQYRAGSRGQLHDVIVPIDEEDELFGSPGPCDHESSDSAQAVDHHEPHKVIKPSTDQSAPSSSVFNAASGSPISTPIKPANCSSKTFSFFYKKRKSRTMPPASSGLDDLASPLTSDPPTKLIENFLQRQAASGNVCQDMDMDMDMMDKLPQVLADDACLLNIESSKNKVRPNPKLSSVDQAEPGTSSIKSSSTKPITNAPPNAENTAQHAIYFEPITHMEEVPQGDEKLLTTASPPEGNNRQCPAIQNMSTKVDTSASYSAANDRDADDAYKSHQQSFKAKAIFGSTQNLKAAKQSFKAKKPHTNSANLSSTRG